MRRVFISYSHDSDNHTERVQTLVDRLRVDGVNVIIDRDMLPGGPPEGWDLWSERQVKEADAVLLVCTRTYCERYEGNQPPGTGLGAAAEAATIRQFIYDQAGFNEKVRVILFDVSDEEYIPSQLRRYHFFQAAADADYDRLRRWLLGSEPSSVRAHPQPRMIRWPSDVPAYSWQLADRKDEFAAFKKMITSQSPHRILLVRGVSNTGKTALLAELVAYARHSELTATFLDFKGCPMLDDLFETLRLDLGQQILQRAHTASGSARFYQLISDLQQLSSPLVLVFDTYEQASQDAQKWLETQFLPRLDRAPGVVVVIGGQLTPEHDRHSWRALTDARELRPIRRLDDWLEYSQRKWQRSDLKHEYVEAITLATGGSPGQVSALLETIVRGLQPTRGPGNESRRRHNET